MRITAVVHWSSHLLWLLVMLVHHTGGEEYCWESFNATCRPDEIVMMQSAFYGRMRKGRCLDTQRFAGCFRDVLPTLDKRCSGRHGCEFKVPDNELHNLQICSKDLMTYMEADFTCQQVARSPGFPCSTSVPLVLSESSGFIANLVTEEDEHGSPRCPWVIRVPDGQLINLTLYDFTLPDQHPQDSSLCNIYANVHEPGVSSPPVHVCGGEQRVKTLYISETNEVEIEVITTPSTASSSTGTQPAYFMLKYEAVGCADLPAPQYAFVKRTPTQLSVTCNATQETWHLVCDGARWVGKMGNCTPAVHEEIVAKKDPFPYGFVIAVIIGLILGIVIGVSMLAFVIGCQRRISRSRRRRGTQCDVIKDVDRARILKSGEYGYAHVWELQHLRAQAEGDQRTCVKCTSTPTAQMSRAPSDQTMHSQRCPYFQATKPPHMYEFPQFSHGDRQEELGSIHTTPFYSEFDPTVHNTSLPETQIQTHESNEEARYTN